MILLFLSIIGTKSGSESVKEQNGETDDGGMKAYFYVFDYQTKDGDYPQVSNF